MILQFLIMQFPHSMLVYPSCCEMIRWGQWRAPLRLPQIGLGTGRLWPLETIAPAMHSFLVMGGTVDMLEFHGNPRKTGTPQRYIHKLKICYAMLWVYTCMGPYFFMGSKIYVPEACSSYGVYIDLGPVFLVGLWFSSKLTLRKGRHLDTAASYWSQEAVASVCRHSGVAAKDVVITTKIWPLGDGPAGNMQQKHTQLVGSCWLSHVDTRERWFHYDGGALMIFIFHAALCSIADVQR